jgi:hypothetical protein
MAKQDGADAYTAVNPSARIDRSHLTNISDSSNDQKGGNSQMQEKRSRRQFVKGS